MGSLLQGTSCFNVFGNGNQMVLSLALSGVRRLPHWTTAAWPVSKENADRRIVLGMLAIVAGGAVL